jgi:phosphate-selective porin OprO/OprP
MNFNKKLATAVSGAVLLMAGQIALADSTTDIVDALVGKGILTEEEGKLITKGHEEKKKATLDTKFKDGFVMESSDGKNSMKIGGRLHMDYRHFGNNTDNLYNTTSTNGTSKESDTYDVRRARIELSGTYRKYWDYLISADLAGATNGQTTSCNATTIGTAGGTVAACAGSKDVSILDQAYLNFKPMPEFQIRAGQFKSPMNLEKLTSSNNMDFQERSVVNQLAPNEDRGVMIHGVPRAGLTYALGFMSGEGAKNRNDANARVDELEYVGRISANFAQLVDNKDAVLHLAGSASTTEFGKASTAGTNNEGVSGWLSGTSAFRTEARGVEYLKLPALTQSNGVSEVVKRERYGLEAAAAYGPFKFQGEYMRNDFKANLTSTTKLDAGIDASYIEAMWILTGEKYADFYKDGIFGGLKPKQEFDFEKGGLGLWEVGVRYSELDAGDFAPYAQTTTGIGKINTINTASVATKDITNTLKVDTMVLGLKWVPNNNTRVLLNYVKTDFDTPIYINGGLRNSETAVTSRIQFMF